MKLVESYLHTYTNRIPDTNCRIINVPQIPRILDSAISDVYTPTIMENAPPQKPTTNIEILFTVVLTQRPQLWHRSRKSGFSAVYSKLSGYGDQNQKT